MGVVCKKDSAKSSQELFTRQKPAVGFTVNIRLSNVHNGADCGFVY